jgi:hypothetical protein
VPVDEPIVERKVGPIAEPNELVIESEEELVLEPIFEPLEESSEEPNVVPLKIHVEEPIVEPFVMRVEEPAAEPAAESVEERLDEHVEVEPVIKGSSFFTKFSRLFKFSK